MNESPFTQRLNAVLIFGFALAEGSLPPWSEDNPMSDEPACHAFLGDPAGPDGLVVVRIVGNDGTPHHVVGIASSQQVTTHDYPTALEPFEVPPAKWATALRTYLTSYKLVDCIDSSVHPDLKPRWLMFVSPATGA